MKKVFLLLIVLTAGICVQAQLVKGNERLEEYLPLTENRRVGLVCNHTSLINGVHLADSLLGRGVNITVLFTPEHGLKGTQEAGKLIDGVSYYKNGIKIISLYGKNKKPSKEQMNEVDIVLFDLQDVGCRFYTYISTLEYVMKTCIEANKPLVVLDRPNPNNFVAGPVLKNDCRSFVGMQKIPICYGLTVGEYANMINNEHWVDTDGLCDLVIVPMENYKRDSIYALDVYPSPNLQSMQAIRNYPTLCLFEGTPISVGRGTQYPFEVIGFPAEDAESTVQKDWKALEDKEKVVFTPKSIKGVAENPPHKDKTCFGKKIMIHTDGIEIEYVMEMYRAYPQKEGFFTRMFDLLAGDKSVKELIIAGKSAEDIRKSWEKDLEDYKEVRERYLIY